MTLGRSNGNSETRLWDKMQRRKKTGRADGYAGKTREAVSKTMKTSATYISVIIRAHRVISLHEQMVRHT